MAKETVGELYISLGLDITNLDADLALADKTVSNAVSRLNSEEKRIRIKTDIDLARLDGVGTELDKLKVKETGITREIELQAQKVQVLKAAYQQAQKADRARGLTTESAATQRTGNAYLAQEKQLALLEARLRKIQVLQAKMDKTPTAFGKIEAGAGKAREGLTALSGAYGAVSAKAMALMAIVTTGAGLFNITKSAMDAGEATYKLSQRLGLTAAEVGKLSRVFAISGVDIQKVAPFLAQLDGQVLASGRSMNTTGAALLKFGVNLRDNTGNLLPLNEQLTRLAQGYQAAAASGQEGAFVAEVLKERGSSLIPLLQDYNENMELASQIKTTGLLDPEEAHKLSLQWRVMQGEAGQLKMAFGAAMMPIAQEIMPEVVSGMQSLVETIRDNKTEIKDGIEGWGAVLKGVGGIALEVAGDVGSLINLITKEGGKIAELTPTSSPFIKSKWDAYDQKVQKANGINAAGIGGGIGTIAGGIGGALLAGGSTFGIGTGAGAVAGGIAGKQIGEKLGVNASRIYHDIIGDWDEMAQKAEDLGKKTEDTAGKVDKETEATKKNSQAANENQTAQQKAAAAMEERGTAAGKLKEKIYQLTHSDLDNARRAMEIEAQEATANGVPEDTVKAFIEAQSARINEDQLRNVTAPMAEAFQSDLKNQLSQIDLQAMAFKRAGAGEEQAAAWANARKSQITADWDRQVAEQIKSVWQTAYEAQLTRIEKEKQAWIKKGLDEVTATRWAEAEKKKVQQQSAQDMFTNQYKYLQIYRNITAKGGTAEQAGMAIAAQMRQDKGIPEGAMTTPGEIAGFQRAMDVANKNLIPIISDGTYRGVKAAMVEVIRGSSSNFISPGGYGGYAQGGIEVIRGANSSYEMCNAGKVINYAPAETVQNAGESLANKGEFTVNVNVNGMEDAAGKVAEAGADLISRALGGVAVGGGNFAAGSTA